MRQLLDALRALGVTLRNVARPPVTQRFPAVVRPRAERYRTGFALLKDEAGDEKCIGCLMCERICPSQVITLKTGPKRESPVTGKKRGYADDFTLDLNACIYCELCVQVCPEDAIVMTSVPEQPAYAREELVLTMDRLYANGRERPHAWADGTKLMGMQELPKPPKPAPAVPAPTTAAPTPAAPPPAPASTPGTAPTPSAAPEPAPSASPVEAPRSAP